jgi:ArsR family transcriptional regulator
MKNTAPNSLADATRLLKAFADPVRLRLLNLLSGDREEVCVCHLHEALGLAQPTVSRHLAYLRRHGVVVGRKEGLWVYYRLANSRGSLHRILLACLDSCLGDPDVFDQDRQSLERAVSCCEGGD